MTEETVWDYAIVGGGIAGLYAAHRLLKAGKGSVHVYEKEPTWGGRLLSVDMPGLPYRAELGGMRFLDRHLLVNHLVRQLGLTSRPFGFDGTKKLMYLRGCHIREGEDCNYKLDRAERSMKCDELVTHAIRCALREIQLQVKPDQTPNAEQAALAADIDRVRARLLDLYKPTGPSKAEKAKLGPEALKKLRRKEKLEAKEEQGRRPGEKLKFGIDYFSAREWELIKRFGELHGSRLYDIGFWNLLQHYLSSEAFLFLHDALGYESIVLNWNAAEATQWFLRDFSGKYRTLEEGMQVLAAEICLRYRTNEGELVSNDHELKKITRPEGARDARWKLHFTVSHKDPRTKKKLSYRKTILARNVILALTSSDVKDVELPWDVMALSDLGEGIQPMEGMDIDAGLPYLLNAVRGQRLFKLFLGYDNVWWDDPRGIEGTSGTANTDLPIRQVYYWGPDKSINPDVPTHYGMLMASYSDSHYVDFWEPMLRTPKPQGDEKKPYCTIPGLVETDKWLQAYGVSENMVKKAHRQVRMLHPELSMADRIPEPVVALVKDWPNGWHAWRVHALPWLVMKGLKQPLPKDTLFICGEAFSEDQGWVEGALRSTELVLQQIGLEPPGIDDEKYRKVGYATYSNYIGNWADLDDS
jgi:hypothetical protein